MTTRQSAPTSPSNILYLRTREIHIPKTPAPVVQDISPRPVHLHSEETNNVMATNNGTDSTSNGAGARPDNGGPGAGDVLQQTFQVLQNMMSGMALQHVELIKQATKNMSAANTNIKAPRAFDGSCPTYGPVRFLNEYENYIKNAHPDDASALQRNFSSNLQGRAATWYMSIIYDTPAAQVYEEVKERFLNRFCEEDPAMIQQTFRFRTQQDHESVEQYTTDMEALLLNSKLTPDSRLEFYIKGLRASLAKMVYLRQPKTIREAERIAKEVELSQEAMTSSSQSEALATLLKDLKDMRQDIVTAAQTRNAVNVMSDGSDQPQQASSPTCCCTRQRPHQDTPSYQRGRSPWRHQEDWQPHYQHDQHYQHGRYNQGYRGRGRGRGSQRSRGRDWNQYRHYSQGPQHYRESRSPNRLPNNFNYRRQEN